MTWVLMMMIGISLLVFFTLLGILLWGIKNRQFDDDYKFTMLNDDEEALKEAIELENRKKRALKRAAKKPL